VNEEVAGESKQPPGIYREEGMRFEENITIGDKYGPAMKIINQEEADRYFEDCVEHTMSFSRTREEAISIEKQNLGYFAWYYDSETMQRVNRLFKTSHPVFGNITPTPEEAFETGKKLAEDMR